MMTSADASFPDIEFAAADDGRAAGCPPLVTLAAHLEKRLEADELREVEAHLAGCTACRELVAETQHDLARQREVLTLVPQRVIIAAAALVPDAITSEEDHVASARPSGWRILWRGAAAAAMVAICAAGYQLGAALPSGQSATATQGDALGSAMTFGLVETDDPAASLVALEVLEDRS